MQDKINLVINIPYHPGNLGKAYNNFMSLVKDDDWVLFLDHDILILRPNWYELCINTIKTLRDNNRNPGWITGVTNSIGCLSQLASNAPTSMDLEEHIVYSNKLYKQYKDTIVEQKKLVRFSGMFILTSKKAWQSIGGFEEEEKQITHEIGKYKVTFHCNKFLGVDNDYHLKLTKAGYESFILPGLYMYHIREKKNLYACI